MIQKKSDHYYETPEVKVINVECAQICAGSETTEKFNPVDPDDDFNNGWN